MRFKNATALSAVQQIEFDAAQAMTLDVFRAHVGMFRDTVTHDTRGRDSRHLGNTRIVGVEHGDPVGWQLLDELLLRLLNAFDGTQTFEVHR